jgi:SPP1 gp7 family putative phage head morphogenesis protein
MNRGRELRAAIEDFKAAGERLRAARHLIVSAPIAPDPEPHIAGPDDFADFVALAEDSRRDVSRRIGRPGSLVVRGAEEAASALESSRESLAALIEKASTPEEAERLVKTWKPDKAAWKKLGEALFEATVKADLGGDLMVRGDEKNRVIQMAEPARSRPLLNLPWREAIKEFVERGIMDPDELSTLLRDYTQRSAIARQLMLERVQDVVRGELVKSLEEGKTFQQFAQALRDGDLDIDTTNKPYLQNVFRTNVQSAYGAGRFRAMTDPDVLEERPYVEYRTVGDARVRESHRALEGKVFDARSDEWHTIAPPNGYNCFPGDTLVQGKFATAVRALYTGELVKLTTQTGRELTVTPNHPLLTSDGFAAASSVRQGQYVVAYHGVDEASMVGKVDPENAPAAIEQVFDALLVRHGPDAMHRTRPVANDFDGDAACFESDVDVVSADRELLSALKAKASHHLGQGILTAPLLRPAAHRSDGALVDLGVAADTPARAIPSAGALSSDGGRVELQCAPLEQLSFGLAAHVNASLYEPALKDRAADASLVGQLLEGYPASVFLDEIVRVDREWFHGYVYDLESPERGWLVANGVFASNCRCSAVLLTREEAEGKEISTKIPEAYEPTPGFHSPPIAKISRTSLETDVPPAT